MKITNNAPTHATNVILKITFKPEYFDVEDMDFTESEKLDKQQFLFNEWNGLYYQIVAPNGERRGDFDQTFLLEGDETIFDFYGYLDDGLVTSIFEDVTELIGWCIYELDIEVVRWTV
jgi:hypothetical protein